MFHFCMQWRHIRHNVLIFCMQWRHTYFLVFCMQWRHIYFPVQTIHRLCGRVFRWAVQLRGHPRLQRALERAREEGSNTVRSRLASLQSTSFRPFEDGHVDWRHSAKRMLCIQCCEYARSMHTVSRLPIFLWILISILICIFLYILYIHEYTDRIDKRNAQSASLRSWAFCLSIVNCFECVYVNCKLEY